MTSSNVNVYLSESVQPLDDVIGPPFRHSQARVNQRTRNRQFWKNANHGLWSVNNPWVSVKHIFAQKYMYTFHGMFIDVENISHQEVGFRNEKLFLKSSFWSIRQKIEKENEKSFDFEWNWWRQEIIPNIISVNE